MNTQYKSQVKNDKTRYILGVEAYSRKNKLENIFDINADYSNCFSINEITVVSFFRVPVYKIIRQHDVINYFLFGFNIKSESIAEIFYERNLKQIDIDYDDAYFLNWASGETFSWLAYAAKIHFARNNSKKPLIVVGRGSYIDLVHMYLPDIPCVANRSVPFDTENPYLEFAGHRFFRDCHHSKIATYLSFHTEFLPDAKGVFKHFALSGIQKDNLDYAAPIKSEPIVPIESKESLAQKISQMKLNSDNFVFLAPEANTYLKPPVEFWEKIVQKLLNDGVDVFLNSINENHYIPGCKSLSDPLTYSESFELASMAKAVISLRSGFSETLLPTQTPSIVIMTIGMGMYGPPNYQTGRNENPMIQTHYVKEEDARGIWYFDYDSSDEAAERVLYLYDEMIKQRVAGKGDTR